MDFEDYRLKGREKYAAFVNAIQQILSAAVKVQAMSPHALTGRAKDADSLKKKLKDRNIDPSSEIDEQVKDLAGTRVVFLTNAQVQRFLGSGIIHENFEVISVNVHHAIPGTEKETQLFSSTNYFVQLKSDRLALPEYASFAGLNAEIQVQTLLNHAWAEMNHDTFYKEPAFRYVERAQFDRVRERMDIVMREHLLPAGHDFDKIARDIALLTKAEEAFEPAVETIKNSTCNDEISAALETLEDVVMPRVSERRERFLKLLPDLAGAVNRARGTPAAKIDTDLGSYDGKTGEDVAHHFASLFHSHRYCDPQQTLTVLLQLYASSEADVERKLWLEQGRRFAENDLDVWKIHGPANQRIIVDGIAALEPAEAKRSQRIVLCLLEQVLSAEVSGTSRGDEPNAIVFHQGAVVPSEALKDMRAEAISILARMLSDANGHLEQAEILQALRQAARPPFHGGSVALRTVVMNDAARIAAIERTAMSAFGLEMRRQAETTALNVHYWYRALPQDMADDDGLSAAHGNVLSEILTLRDALNADEDYVLYKTLIGHDSVRPEAWDSDPFDFDATDAWRSECYPNILARIDAEGADAWNARIHRYLCEPIPAGTGGALIGFSQRLAQDRPDIAVHLLERMDETFSPLLVPLITGMDEIGRIDAVQLFVDRWITEGRFLAAIVDWLASRAAPDLQTLTAIVIRAQGLGDDAAMLSAVNAAARLWDQAADQRLINDVFVPAVAYFAEVKQPSWIRQAWQIRRAGLVAALNEDQIQLLLRSIAALPEIDHSADRVLAIIADQCPALVLEFFGRRIRRDRAIGGARFDPIPFSIYELPKALSKHPSLVLAAVRSWHDLDPSLHQFTGGRLVSNVFPKLPQSVAAPLTTLISNGTRDDLSFVLATLQPYEGIEEIYPLCMDIVDRLEPGDDMLRRVAFVLGETGVVSGEFGFVEAQNLQRIRLQRYLQDARPKVRAFSREIRRKAEQSMAWEQRRAEQDVEQMRRDWN